MKYVEHKVFQAAKLDNCKCCAIAYFTFQLFKPVEICIVLRLSKRRVFA